jgi:hypothetical protein
LFAVNLPLYAVFSMLGSLLGLAVFRNEGSAAGQRVDHRTRDLRAAERGPDVSALVSVARERDRERSGDLRARGRRS